MIELVDPCRTQWTALRLSARALSVARHGHAVHHCENSVSTHPGAHRCRCDSTLPSLYGVQQ